MRKENGGSRVGAVVSPQESSRTVLQVDRTYATIPIEILSRTWDTVGKIMLLDRLWVSLLDQQYRHTSHVGFPFEWLILLFPNSKVVVRFEDSRVIAELRPWERRIYKIIVGVLRSVVLRDNRQTDDQEQ